MKNYKNWLVLIFSNENISNENSNKEEYFQTQFYVSDILSIEEEYKNTNFIQNLTNEGGVLLEKLSASNNLLIPDKTIEAINNNHSTSFLRHNWFQRLMILFKKLKNQFKDIKVNELTNENGNFTYVYNSNLKSPFSYVSVKLNTEINDDNFIKISLYQKMAHLMNKSKYDIYWTINKFKCQTSITKAGIEFCFSGISETIIACIAQYFDNFFKIDMSFLTTAKNHFVNELNNKEMNRDRMYFLKIITEHTLNMNYFTNDMIDKINEESLKFDHKYYLNMFICSETKEESFKALYVYVFKKLMPSTKYNFNPRIQDSSYISFASNDNKKNGYIFLIQSILQKDTRSQAIMRTILEYLLTRFFTDYRNENKENIIHLDIYNTNGLSFFYLHIEGNYTSKVLYKKIKDHFVRKNDAIKLTKNAELSHRKNFAITEFKKELHNLAEYFNYYRELYYADASIINYDKEVIKYIKFIEKKDLEALNKCLELENYTVIYENHTH